MRLAMLLSHLLVCLASPTAAGVLTWLPLREAAEKAAAESKLLLIVQGPDAITETAETSKVLSAYQKAALTDSRVSDFYDFRAVAHYRPTGAILPSNSSNRTPRLKNGNVVTYFCLVDPQNELLTIHLFVGFPMMEQLQAHCEWASELHTQILSLPASQRRDKVKQAHQGRVWRAPNLPPQTLKKDLFDVSQHRDRQLLQRFGQGWTVAEAKPLLTKLRVHADLEGQCGHWILSRHPLISYFEIEQQAFELLTHQTFWSPPLRRAALKDWFLNQRKRNRPLFIVLTKRSTAKLDSDTFHSRHWTPKRYAIHQHLRGFDALEVSPTEFACLATDLSLTITWQNGFNKQGFVVVPANSKQLTVLEHDVSEQRLERLLRKVASLAATNPDQD